MLGGLKQLHGHVVVMGLRGDPEKAQVLLKGLMLSQVEITS